MWALWIGMTAFGSELPALQADFDAMVEQSTRPEDAVISALAERVAGLEKTEGRTAQSAVLAGQLALASKDGDTAMKHFEWVIETHPTASSTAWYQVAQFKERADPAAGLALFERAHAALPDAPDILTGLADRLGTTERAFALYEKASASELPVGSYALERAIQVTHGLKNHARAEPLVERAVTRIADRPYYDREAHTEGKRFIIRQIRSGAPVWGVIIDRPKDSNYAVYKETVPTVPADPSHKGHYLLVNSIGQAVVGPPITDSYAEVMDWVFKAIDWPRP